MGEWVSGCVGEWVSEWVSVVYGEGSDAGTSFVTAAGIAARIFYTSFTSLLTLVLLCSLY